tara:strand:- start:10711 stop:12099 length:1389 start_codon:yes stop_codon:yes gene_type:complete
MTKKNRRAKVKSELYYKSPCGSINQILLIKKLNEPQASDMYSKLKLLVDTLGKDIEITDYIKVLIKELIFDPSSLEVYLEDSEVRNLVLHDVYECIVDIYLGFRLEIICADLNGLQVRNPFEPVNPKDFGFLENLIGEASAAPKPENKAAKEDFNLTMQDLSKIEAFLKKNVIGQNSAIETLIDRLKLISVKFKKRGAYFFIGRTGVGKTQLAKLFGKKYCGNFAKINCGEFTNGHEVSKLIGSPPGYIGHSPKSFFSEKSEQSSRWVFLFDEIEKAHHKLFDVLLSLLDDGTMMDSAGNQLDFTNSIFIFTSNQGVSDIKEKGVGFKQLVTTFDSNKETLKSALDNLFSPEFRNRIDEFIYFNELTEADVKEIVKIELKAYPVHQTDSLLNYVVKNSYSKEYGAREIKRFIEKNIALLIANTLLANMLPIDGTGKYTLDIVDGKLTMGSVVYVPPKVAEAN